MKKLKKMSLEELTKLEGLIRQERANRQKQAEAEALKEFREMIIKWNHKGIHFKCDSHFIRTNNISIG